MSITTRGLFRKLSYGDPLMPLSGIMVPITCIVCQHLFSIRAQDIAIIDKVKGKKAKCPGCDANHVIGMSGRVALMGNRHERRKRAALNKPTTIPGARGRPNYVMGVDMSNGEDQSVMVVMQMVNGHLTILGTRNANEEAREYTLADAQEAVNALLNPSTGQGRSGVSPAVQQFVDEVLQAEKAPAEGDTFTSADAHAAVRKLKAMNIPTPDGNYYFEDGELSGTPPLNP